MDRWLLLLRHGKSDRNPRYDTDFERPLAPRGIQAASAMGQFLASYQPPVQLIVSSPAERAICTARLVQTELNAAPLEENESIYAASLSRLLYVVSALPDAVACALLVGHNPGFEELAGHLTHDNLIIMKTCSLAIIRLEGATWADAAQHPGILELLQHPRELEL